MSILPTRYRVLVRVVRPHLMLVVTESAMKNFQEQECFRFENVCYGDGLIDSTAAVIVETNDDRRDDRCWLIVPSVCPSPHLNVHIPEVL
jgi:hypothetical protein